MEPRSTPADAGPLPGRAPEWRRGALLAFTLVAWLLPLQHCHFKGSDELAVFEMSRSLLDGRGLSVPALRHTEVGSDGRRYSYFAPGQSVLALPWLAAARMAATVLPEAVAKRLEGPPRKRGVYEFGGSLDASFVSLYPLFATFALLLAFYSFQRELAVPPRAAAGVTLALGVGTTVALHANYFLRHTTESAALLLALLGFTRFARTGAWPALAFGAAAACAMPLLRLPSAIAGPALAAYLAWALWTRRDALASTRSRVLAALALGVPSLLALCAFLAVNQAKWGSWLGSPMVEQATRFEHPIGRGLLGLLASPGSSVFVYSPLLLLAPFALHALWQRQRALAAALLALALTLLLFYAGFDGWTGLWSAPGPRYLFAFSPLGLLALALWLGEDATRWRVALALTLLGLGVQIACSAVRWGSIPSLAGYPVNDPDHASFLFEPARSPVWVMGQRLFSGGPYDAWLYELGRGWPGVPASPMTVLLLLLVWGVAVHALTQRCRRVFAAAGVSGVGAREASR